MASGAFEELAVGNETVRVYASGAGDLRPRVVVFHPWWGLNDDVVAYADQLAGAGFSVLAPDLVRGRVAATVDEAEQLIETKDDDHADAVALAAVDQLPPSLLPAKLACVGFSMGAAWSMWCAVQRPAVVASVVYYGTSGLSTLTRARTPVLGHFAQSDPFEPEDSVQQFERTLRGAGRNVVIHRYPETGHWFAEPSRDAWRAEPARLAFDRTVEFLRDTL